MSSVLHHKYKFTKQKADEIADFLLPMLHADPYQRATAEEMLVNYADWFEPKPGDDTPYADQNPPEPASDEEEEELEETDQSVTHESDSFPESGDEGQYESAPARAHSI
ncbi:serine/arginine-rich protein specific kinase SRPK [Diplonema papillatum]|nr:serine/arginine-rich protein specific kinase SRPK [Diplonema papillatum]